MSILKEIIKGFIIWLTLTPLMIVTVFAAIDAYDYERNGSCEECLVLQYWFEYEFQWLDELKGWYGEQGND